MSERLDSAGETAEGSLSRPARCLRRTAAWGIHGTKLTRRPQRKRFANGLRNAGDIEWTKNRSVVAVITGAISLDTLLTALYNVKTATQAWELPDVDADIRGPTTFRTNSRAAARDEYGGDGKKKPEAASTRAIVAYRACAQTALFYSSRAFRELP